MKIYLRKSGFRRKRGGIQEAILHLRIVIGKALAVHKKVLIGFINLQASDNVT